MPWIILTAEKKPQVGSSENKMSKG